MNLPLLALSVASFGIGTSEFVIMGLLPELARQFSVSIPAAGLLVSGYALGVTVGSPLVAALVARLRSRDALLGLIGLFVLGNVLCAVAPSYAVLMAARVLTSFCHGAFFGIGATVAADLVPRAQRARAIAGMFAGLTLANVLGVPFGTALGQQAGWRATFWAVAAIGLVAASGLAWLLPRGRPMPPLGFRTALRALARPQVALAMLLSVLASVSLFSVFTFITPMLERVTGVSPRGVTVALLVFGAGLTAGNFAGGRLADWKLMPSLLGVFAGLVLVLAVLAWVIHDARAMLPAMLVWGVLAFALVAPLQLRILNEAREAAALASILNQGAFNLGNATGAALGGAALSVGMSYASLPWLGAGVALLALGLTALSLRLDRSPAR